MFLRTKSAQIDAQFSTVIYRRLFMLAKLVISSFLSIGALIGATVATHHRSGDCCVARAACCAQSSVCCDSAAKPGCCEIGQACCDENLACCNARGSDCCDEGGAGCDV